MTAEGCFYSFSFFSGFVFKTGMSFPGRRWILSLLMQQKLRKTKELTNENLLEESGVMKASQWNPDFESAEKKSLEAECLP